MAGALCVIPRSSMCEEISWHKVSWRVRMFLEVTTPKSVYKNYLLNCLTSFTDDDPEMLIQCLYVLACSRLPEDAYFHTTSQSELFELIEFNVTDNVKIYDSEYEFTKTTGTFSNPVSIKFKIYLQRTKKEGIPFCNYFDGKDSMIGSRTFELAQKLFELPRCINTNYIIN